MPHPLSSGGAVVYDLAVDQKFTHLAELWQPQTCKAEAAGPRLSVRCLCAGLQPAPVEGPSQTHKLAFCIWLKSANKKLLKSGVTGILHCNRALCTPLLSTFMQPLTKCTNSDVNERATSSPNRMTLCATSNRRLPSPSPHRRAVGHAHGLLHAPRIAQCLPAAACCRTGHRT